MGEFLQLELAGQQGTLALEIAFRLAAPWTCLFGASGSGKSTVLRAVAGFVRLQRAEIVLSGRVLESSIAGMRLPPHRRRVRSAGQQAWLFSGTVRENVQYAGAGSVDEVLTLFHLSGLAETNITRLSGGERQRVNVARAVAAAEGAAILLLDEPFAGMDLRLRDQLASELRAWMARIRVPVLSVSHDVAEAFLLDPEVIRIADGRMLQHGPVAVVLAEEKRRMLTVLSNS